MLNRTEKLNDIIWSPVKEDEFIAYGSDLYLYKVRNSNLQSDSNVIQLCDETYAELIGSYAEHSNPRLVAWCPNIQKPLTFAINTPNHRIQLINLNQPNTNSKQTLSNFEIVKEFSFKQVRQCTNMTWNSYNNNLLAAGFEKIRTEHSILVWDVRGTSSNATNKFENITETTIYSTHLSSLSNSSTTSKTLPYNLSSLANLTTSMNTGSTQSIYQTLNNGLNEFRKSNVVKPVYETGSSETCNSLNWNNHSENLLLAGINGKSLKIFDVKVNMKAVMSINTKYVNSFSSDPAPNAVQYQAVSFYENTIAIWDLRAFDKPVDLIVENDPISKIQWCPSKCGKLAVLSKNRSSIDIYSIKCLNSHASIFNEDENASKQILIDKISRKFSNSCRKDSTGSKINNQQTSSHGHPIPASSNNFLTNFSWYTFDSNKLIVTSNSLMSTLCLSDTIVISFAPTSGDFYWSSNLGKLNMSENVDLNECEFNNQLKERAKQHYGLSYELVNIVNGSASSMTTHNPSTMAIPLSLHLNSIFGIQTLIRSDFNHNIKICSIGNKNTELISNVKYLWQWFESINRFFEAMLPINQRNSEFSSSCRALFMDLYWTRYCGLKSLLDETINKKLANLEQQQTYDDKFRTLAFNLCGWDFKDGCVTRQFFSSLENNNQIERAVCLAFLTQNYEQSLEILDAASKSDPRYGYLWIALKYFHDEQSIKENTKTLNSSSFLSYTSPIQTQNSFILNNKPSAPNLNQTNNTIDTIMFSSALIKECNTLINHFKNPYLKALFNFILNKDDSIRNILHDTSIMFQDRIALSVYFMYNHQKQSELQDFFDEIIKNESIKNANLHGVLLTGLNVKSIELFDAFYEQYGDIQTVALAIIHSPYVEVLNSKQVQYWINSYRELLNKFKLWEIRAEFDVFKMKLIKPQNLIQLSALSQSDSYLNENSQLIHSTSSSNLNKMHQYSSYPSFNRQNSQQNLTSQRQSYMNLRFQTNVHMTCNKCGKNLQEKTPLTIDTNSSNQFYRQNSQYYNSSNANIFGMSSSSLITNQKSIFKPNDQTLNGCSYCARFLPQCTVCLKIMKINLNPNTIQANQTNQITLNRSQSLYANIPLPIYSNNSTDKFALQSKSPTTIQISQSQTLSTNMPHSADMNFHFFSDLNDQTDEIKPQQLVHLENRLKSSINPENIFFLNNNKFGNWFSWCQSCKHGGHINCLINWFKHHDKCPFLHCKCQCLNTDNHIN